MVAAVERAGERIEVRALVDAVRTVLGAADGLPVLRKRNIGGHQEELVLVALAALNQNGQALKILPLGQLIRIFLRALALERLFNRGDGYGHDVALGFAVFAVYDAANHAVVLVRAGRAGADGALLAAGNEFAVAEPVIDVLSAFQLIDLDGQRARTQTLFIGRALRLLRDFRRIAGLGAVIEHDHSAVLFEVRKGVRTELHRIPLLFRAAEIDDVRMAVAAAVRIVGKIRGQVELLQVAHIGHGVRAELLNALQIHVHKAVREIIVSGEFLDVFRQNQLAQTIAMIDHAVQLGHVLRQAQVGQVDALAQKLLAIGGILRINRILKVDAGNAGAILERISAKAGNRSGQIQATLHVGAALERLTANRLQARREGNHGQRRAVVKRSAADFLKVLRQVNARQIGAALKRAVADLHERIRQRNLLQNRLLLERLLADFGHAVRNDQLFLIERQHEQNGIAAVDDAVLEAEGAALGEVDALQRRAAIERLSVQRGQALGQVHGGQRRAAAERSAADAGRALADGDSGQRRAVAERAVARNVAAHGNLGQLGALLKYAAGGNVQPVGQVECLNLGLLERAVIDRRYARRQLQRGQTSVVKCLLSDRGQRAGELYAGHARAIVERFAADGGHALREDHLAGQTRAAGKREFADGLQRAGELHGGDARLLFIGIIANRGHTLGDYQFAGDLNGRKREHDFRAVLHQDIVLHAVNAALGAVDGRDRLTAHERAGVERIHRFGNIDGGQRRAVAERVVRHGGHALFEADRLQRGAVLEDIGLGDIAGNRNGFQLRASGKGTVPGGIVRAGNLGYGVWEDDARDFASAEQRANLGHAVGNGDHALHLAEVRKDLRAVVLQHEIILHAQHAALRTGKAGDGRHAAERVVADAGERGRKGNARDRRHGIERVIDNAGYAFLDHDALDLFVVLLGIGRQAPFADAAAHLAVAALDRAKFQRAVLAQLPDDVAVFAAVDRGSGDGRNARGRGDRGDFLRCVALADRLRFHGGNDVRAHSGDLHGRLALRVGHSGGLYAVNGDGRAFAGNHRHIVVLVEHGGLQRQLKAGLVVRVNGRLVERRIRFGIRIGVRIDEHVEEIAVLNLVGQRVHHRAVQVIANVRGFNAPELGDVFAVIAGCRRKAVRAVRAELLVRRGENIIDGIFQLGIQLNLHVHRIRAVLVLHERAGVAEGHVRRNGRMRHFLRDGKGIYLRVAGVIVHAGPRGIAALDGDHRSDRDRNARRALVFRFANIGVHLIIAVRRRRRNHDALGSFRNAERVLVRIRRERLVQAARAERNRLHGLVRAVVVAAQIRA